MSKENTFCLYDIKYYICITYLKNDRMAYKKNMTKYNALSGLSKAKELD